MEKPSVLPHFWRFWAIYTIKGSISAAFDSHCLAYAINIVRAHVRGLVCVNRILVLTGISSTGYLWSLHQTFRINGQYFCFRIFIHFFLSHKGTISYTVHNYHLLGDIVQLVTFNQKRVALWMTQRINLQINIQFRPFDSVISAHTNVQHFIDGRIFHPRNTIVRQEIILPFKRYHYTFLINRNYWIYLLHFLFRLQRYGKFLTYANFCRTFCN